MASVLSLAHCGGDGKGDARAEAATPEAEADDISSGSASDAPSAPVGSGDAPAENAATPTCGCPSSDALRLLRCDDSAGVTLYNGTIEINSSGDAAIFYQCFEREGQPQTARCRQFRWMAARGTELLTDQGWLLGLADDGTALIASQVDPPENDAPWLVRPDGSRTRVPLDTNARLAADGRVVGFVPPVLPVLEAIDPSLALSTAPAARGPLARWSLPAAGREEPTPRANEVIDGQEYDVAAPGLEVLARLPDAVIDGGLVYDVSGDASVIVGGGTGVVDGFARGLPLLWTSAGGLRVLPGAPTDDVGTALQRVSRDGTAVFGSVHGYDSHEWFHWTPVGGFRNVMRIESGSYLSGGIALSDDGGVFSSTALSSNRSRAFRWSPSGISWLGPDDAPSSNADMTADGRVVLGTLVDSDDGFIATPEETRSFTALVASAALELEGWQLRAPVRISDDGGVVFGFAGCGAQKAPYRWVLPR